MPAVVRSGDINTASAAVTSSRNVNVNGKSITVTGDPVADHPVNHTGIKTANGFNKVLVGGTPVNHVGNADTCSTHTRSTGSGNVNINTSG
mgnify:FL=1